MSRLTILLIPTLLFSTICSGQSKSTSTDDLYYADDREAKYQLNPSFTLVDGLIVWQKVYETDHNTEALMTALLESAIYENITNQTADRISGEIKFIEPQAKAAGYSVWNTPGGASPAIQLTGTLTYEFREGRYRATISRIEYSLLKATQIHSPIKETIAARNPIEDIFVRRSEINPRQFTEVHQAIYDYTFTTKFEIKPNVDNSW